MANGDIDNISKIVVIFTLIIQVRLFSLGGLLAIETSLHIQTCVWKSYSNLMDLILWYGGWINKIYVLIHLLIYSINIYWPSLVSATAPDTEDYNSEHNR